MCAIEHLVVHTGFAELSGPLWNRLWSKHCSGTSRVVHVVRLEHEPLTGIVHRLQQHRQGPLSAQNAGDETMRGRCADVWRSVVTNDAITRTTFPVGHVSEFRIGGGLLTFDVQLKRKASRPARRMVHANNSFERSQMSSLTGQ